MSFNLNYWLKETINIDNVGGISIYQKVRPRIVCQDGYSVSVQASEYAYCEPHFTQFQNEDGWHVINGNYWLSSDTPRNFETGTIYRRGLKFCDQCKMELEQFLDDEFSHLPATANVTVDGKM